MGLKFSNNAASHLAVAVAAGDVTLTLTAGEGSKFPVLGPGDWHPLTLTRSDGTMEIVTVTARNVDVLTVTRGQENTTATTFNVGDRAESRITAAAMQALKLNPKLATLSANTTFTAADTDTTKIVSAACTALLPLANTVPAGRSISVKSITFQSLTVGPQGTDTLDGFSSGNYYRIGAYDIWEFMSDGVSAWYAVRKGTEVGTFAPYGGAACPFGWLPCDGTGYSITTYGGLYAVMGTTYGSTNGFQVPDLRGRTIIGAGQGSGLTNRPRGTVGGEENHILSTGEMAYHDHGLEGSSQTLRQGTGYSHLNGNGSWNFAALVSSAAAAGSGSAHNNMQPFNTATMMVKG